MIYLFDNQENLIKILTDKIVKSVYQTQELTTENYISDKLIVEVRAMNDVDLSKVEYIAVASRNKAYSYDLFFVLSHNTKGTITEFIGVQSGIEELRKTPIYDIRPNGNVRQHATQIVNGSNWTIGYTPNVTSMGVDYYYMSAFDALKKMCLAFGVEMQFHVEINGNRIGNRYIEIKKRIGEITHRRVTYGHNALEIVKEVQKANLYTALIGRGRGEEVSSAEENESGQAGYGRKINFGEIEWKRSEGNPVDKPLGQQYVEIKEATNLFGTKTPNGNVPKIGFIEFDVEDREILLQRTYESLVEQARPQVLFKTTSAYLTAEIGDTVRVERPDLNIDYAVRVVKIEWDRIADRAVSLELGDKLSDNLGSKLKSIANDVENRLNDTIFKQSQKLLDYLPSADGFNTNWYSEAEPSNPRINDIWFMPDPQTEGHKQIRVWTGEVWERVDVDPKELEDKFTQASQQIADLNALIEETDSKAEDILRDLGLTTDLAERAKEIAETAKSELLSKFNDYVTESTFGSFQEITNKAISQRLTATEIENEINSKGFSTVTQLNNLRTETAGLIEQRITSVKADIPKNISDANLLKGTENLTIGNGGWASGHFRQSGPGKIQVVEITDSPINTNKAIRITANSNSEVGIAQNRLKLTAGNYHLGLWVKGQVGTQIRLQGYWRIGDNSGNAGSFTIEKTGWNWIVTDKLTKADDVTLDAGYVYLSANQLGKSIEVIGLMLAKTDTPFSNWYPSLDSFVTTTDFHVVRDKSNLHERILGTSEEGAPAKIAQLVMSNNLFQTTVGEYATKPNLLKNSSFSENFDEWGGRGGSIQNGWAVIDGQFGVNKYYGQHILNVIKDDPIDTEYVVSMDLEVTNFVAGNTNSLVRFYIDGRHNGSWLGATMLPIKDFSQANNQGIVRFEQKFKIDKSRSGITNFALYIFARDFTGRLRFRNIKLERGSKSTPWTDNMSYTSTKFTQLADSISLGLFGQNGLVSGTFFGRDGVKIQGKLINLDGLTTMTDAFANNLITKNFSTQNLTAFVAKINALKAITVDVDNLTGNYATLLQAMFSSTTSNFHITGNGFALTTNEINKPSVTFDYQGIDFFGKLGPIDMRVGRIGHFFNREDRDNPLKYSVGIAANALNKVMFGYQGDDKTGINFKPAAIINGATGDFDIWTRLRLINEKLYVPDIGNTDQDGEQVYVPVRFKYLSSQDFFELQVAERISIFYTRGMWGTRVDGVTKLLMTS